MHTFTRSGQPLAALPFAFFDVETTGLLPAHGHRICEIGLLRVRAGQIEAFFDQLLDPQCALDEQAAAVNGLSHELLQGAPVFETVVHTLLELLHGAVLVAHNAPFDVIFLIHELQLLNLPAPRMPVLDTLVLARRLIRQPSYSLAALACTFHLPMPQHRAMSDVMALRALFEYLVPYLAAQGITTLEETLRFQRGLLPNQPDPVPPPLIDQALREGRRLRIVYRSRTTQGPTERLIQPLEVTQEPKGLFLRAYCYLRNDLRSFIVNRIESMELA